MDQLPLSEVLPGLYRAVLDAVARLEASGRRRDAAAIRTEATAAYSRAWNATAERRLRTLRIRADRLAVSHRRAGPQPREARRRPIDLEQTPA